MNSISGTRNQKMSSKRTKRSSSKIDRNNKRSSKRTKRNHTRSSKRTKRCSSKMDSQNRKLKISLIVSNTEEKKKWYHLRKRPWMGQRLKVVGRISQRTMYRVLLTLNSAKWWTDSKALRVILRNKSFLLIRHQSKVKTSRLWSQECSGCDFEPSKRNTSTWRKGRKTGRPTARDSKVQVSLKSAHFAHVRIIWAPFRFLIACSSASTATRSSR